PSGSFAISSANRLIAATLILACLLGSYGSGFAAALQPRMAPNRPMLATTATGARHRFFTAYSSAMWIGNRSDILLIDRAIVKSLMADSNSPCRAGLADVTNKG